MLSQALMAFSRLNYLRGPEERHDNAHVAVFGALTRAVPCQVVIRAFDLDTEVSSRKMKAKKRSRIRQ